jgi:hypothetical protein
MAEHEPAEDLPCSPSGVLAGVGRRRRCSMSGEAVAQQAGEAAAAQLAGEMAARRPGEAAAKEEDKEERTWVGPTWARDERRR